MKKHFSLTSGVMVQRVVGLIKAVDDVSFSLQRGETLGLVGESGCGKTTVCRCILYLDIPTSGEVIFEGRDLSGLTPSEFRTSVRPKMQLIFQDPYSSLNPRMTVEQIIGEPPSVFNLVGSRLELKDRIAELLSIVGLSHAIGKRFPHELSGGQRQRVGVARALAVKPDLVICDEPVSALDVSIQAQIINLLDDLQEKLGLTYLFIAHDLSVVRHISSRIAVMYLGKIIEIAGRQEIYEHPLHPYTKALMSAVPIPDPKVEAQRRPIILKGEVPSPLNPPSGCAFHPRCYVAEEKCSKAAPELREVHPNHWVSCFPA